VGVPKEPASAQRGNIFLGIEARLVALFTIIGGLVTLYQVFGPSPATGPSQPVVVGRSEAEVERDVEKARRELLEKVMTDQARERQEAARREMEERQANERAEVRKADAERLGQRSRQDTAVPSEPQKQVAALPPPKLAPCIEVGRRIESPILVSAGTQLCPTPDGVRATVHEITSFGVVYSTYGYKRETCQKSERCTFAWQGAPEFSIDVVDGPSGRQGVLVAAP
jgi:hypothetical protein